jgi:hypothetical protein
MGKGGEESRELAKYGRVVGVKRPARLRGVAGTPVGTRDSCSSASCGPGRNSYARTEQATYNNCKLYTRESRSQPISPFQPRFLFAVPRPSLSAFAPFVGLSSSPAGFGPSGGTWLLRSPFSRLTASSARVRAAICSSCLRRLFRREVISCTISRCRLASEGYSECMPVAAGSSITTCARRESSSSSSCAIRWCGSST